MQTSQLPLLRYSVSDPGYYCQTRMAISSPIGINYPVSGLRSSLWCWQLPSLSASHVCPQQPGLSSLAWLTWPRLRLWSRHHSRPEPEPSRTAHWPLRYQGLSWILLLLLRYTDSNKTEKIMVKLLLKEAFESQTGPYSDCKKPF